MSRYIKSLIHSWTSSSPTARHYRKSIIGKEVQNALYLPKILNEISVLRKCPKLSKCMIKTELKECLLDCRECSLMYTCVCILVCMCVCICVCTYEIIYIPGKS